VVTLRGALAPFAQASDVWQRLTGLRFSTAPCRRVTERVGAELHAQHPQQAVTPPTLPDGDFTLPERDGPRFAGAVGYVGRDAFTVPPRADGRGEEVILDFYHVAQHLHDFAQLWHPVDEKAAQALAGEWCHQLKHAGGVAVQRVLTRLELRGRSAAVREAHRQLVGYFANPVHRRDSPRYRAKGWQIGSGPVESACQPVVGQRLKGPGMRWGAAGADALCQLRALFKSEAGQWDGFWNPSRN
jgi:hypothetical protein